MLVLLVAAGAALTVYRFCMAVSDSALELVDTTTSVAKAYGAVTAAKQLCRTSLRLPTASSKPGSSS